MPTPDRALTSGICYPVPFVEAGSMWTPPSNRYGRRGAEKGYNPNAPARIIHWCLLQSHQGNRRGAAAHTAMVLSASAATAAQMPPRMRLIFGDSGFFGEPTGYRPLSIKVKPRAGALPTSKRDPAIRLGTIAFLHQVNGNRHLRGTPKTLKHRPHSIRMSRYDCFCYVTTERLTPAAHTTYGQRATKPVEAKNQGWLTSRVMTFGQLTAVSCAVMAYNTVRWMALLSYNDTLKHWEIQTIRTFLIRTAANFCAESSTKVKVPDNHLYPSPWADWLSCVHPLTR
ncbi:MAG: hypothetical protein IPM37_15180 [Hahellaceae bacterium]|nr:hypothetical protein [Hahellaceae bacterium]